MDLMKSEISVLLLVVVQSLVLEHPSMVANSITIALMLLGFVPVQTQFNEFLVLIPLGTAAWIFYRTMQLGS